MESIYELKYDRCKDTSYYRYAGELRYYPLDEGPPGPQVCLEKN